MEDLEWSRVLCPERLGGAASDPVSFAGPSWCSFSALVPTT